MVMKKLLNNRKTWSVGLPYVVVIIGFVIMQSLTSARMLGSTVTGYLVPICVYISLAVSLNLLVGVCGELSLGHAGFMGIGAFAGIVIAALLKGKVESDMLRLALAMLGGGAFAGVLGFLIGIPVLRLRGDYLAIVTLAFGEILKNIIGNLYVGTDSAGFHMALSTEKMELLEDGVYFIAGPKGATGVQKLATFGMGIILVLFTLFVVQNLIHSKEGRAIKAVRDNRIAAESVGINVTAFRMKAFVVSAFLAGMAGALFGLNYSSVTASKFNFNTSINILVFVVLGGMGNIFGSVISATVLYILPEAMRELEDYRMILYAVVLILVMLCTWSPKVKGALQVISAKVKEKVGKIFRKEETCHE